MTDRMGEPCCLGCGNPLIQINDWHLCTACTEELEKNIYEYKKKKRQTNPAVLAQRRKFHPSQLVARSM